MIEKSNISSVQDANDESYLGYELNQAKDCTFHPKISKLASSISYSPEDRNPSSTSSPPSPNIARLSRPQKSPSKPPLTYSFQPITNHSNTNSKFLESSLK